MEVVRGSGGEVNLTVPIYFVSTIVNGFAIDETAESNVSDVSE